MKDPGTKAVCVQENVWKGLENAETCSEMLRLGARCPAALLRAQPPAASTGKIPGETVQGGAFSQGNLTGRTYTIVGSVLCPPVHGIIYIRDISWQWVLKNKQKPNKTTPQTPNQTKDMF